jgi:CubicO group peptidase (beta-lactamase class C family)
MNITSGRSRRITACLLLSIIAVTTACSNSKAVKQDIYSDADVIKLVQGVKNPDYWPTDQWKISTPEAQGMDSGVIAKTINKLPGSNIHSFVLIRNGYLVSEAYNADTDPNMPQDILSATKSITSSLTGIAMKEGKLKETNQKLSEFFPQLVGSAPEKSAITIENLLTMTSGLKWDNEGEKSSNEMADSEDWVKYVLSQPVVGKPGKDFLYSNGNAHLMSAILQKATGMPTSKYAEQKLFEPLGIRDVEWYADPQNIDIGAFSVHIKARDMAKIGYLYLHDGQWNNKEVIPPSWIDATLKKHDDAEYADGSIGSYGYFWWLKNMETGSGSKRINMFYAAGSGGQRIYVLPEQNIVAVFTSNTANSFVTESDLTQIIGAVQSDKPLPENPAGVNELNAAITSFKAVKDKS